LKEHPYLQVLVTLDYKIESEFDISDQYHNTKRSSEYSEKWTYRIADQIIVKYSALSSLFAAESKVLKIKICQIDCSILRFMI